MVRLIVSCSRELNSNCEVKQNKQMKDHKIKASCHCGAEELELFLPNGFDLRRCNCSICSRKGAIVSSVLLDDLKISKGIDLLKLYQFNTKTAKHYFCSIFVAGLVGVDLVFMDFVTIIFTATIASIGAAGIPGVALIMMSMVFTAIGLPIEAIALIAGVDRILDMVRTTVNVTGDLAVSVVIDQSEGTLNERLFNDLNVDLEWEENK